MIVMMEKNPKARTDTAENARANRFLAFNCLTVEITLSIATINNNIPRNMCMFFVSSSLIPCSLIAIGIAFVLLYT